jgi:hypothetical protein
MDMRIRPVDSSMATRNLSEDEVKILQKIIKSLAGVKVTRAKYILGCCAGCVYELAVVDKERLSTLLDKG